ncbi:MAG: alpha/beta fold hydrolase [Bacillota bacterium]|nr:alpha/beta fold hydrolase [Bacillota bacterium]
MLHEVNFPSFNERDTVYGWIYVPAAEPKGIVQLIHGFGEHSRRYLHMISTFVEEGYIVAADDHVGHGKTALENNTWGDWGDKGFHTMMEDEHRLHDLTVKMYPDLPYFLFGHSMGSFIVRDYITKYGDELAGVTICGTLGVWPNLKENLDYLRKLMDDGKGKEADPLVPAKMMGWMFRRCPEGASIGNEWICADPFVQKDHAADPFDAFSRPCLNQSFYYFGQMMEYITGEEWAKKVPAGLPIYNIAGDQDPVGQFGTGVMQTTNWLIDTGHDVETMLYPGYRHEIHNYRDLKEIVEDGILDFMDEHLTKEEE